MISRKLCVMASLAALATLMVAPPVVSASYGDGIRLEARLVPTTADPRASGDAKFQREIDRDGKVRSQFEVNVQDISSTRSVRVLVNGLQVGTIEIGGYRNGGELRLDSEDGDVVPALKDGDVVQVVNAANGTVLLQGTLKPGRRR